MRVLLTYDELGDIAPDGLPEDFGAEYESRTAVQHLLGAIQACGHEAAKLPLDENFVLRLQESDADLVFNVAEGIRGPQRESVVPAWLDHLDMPYTGSDGLSLAISLDKALTKTLVAGRGVRTPAFQRVTDISELAAINLEFPLFVKPNAEGSSMGIRYPSKVDTPEALEQQVAWVLENYRHDCLVEQFAPGREFCVGILGNKQLQVLPIAEICSPHGFYSYEDKHLHRKELTCPADISEPMAEEMRNMAVEAFRVLRCRDLARVDFKLDPRGRPAFLEINPLPGLAPEYSVFPAQAQAAQFTYERLIGHIMELAVERSCRLKETASR